MRIVRRLLLVGVLVIPINVPSARSVESQSVPVTIKLCASADATARLWSAGPLGTASTLDVVQSVKNRMPNLQESLPADFKVSVLNDQSIFVKAAVSGVSGDGGEV